MSSILIDLKDCKTVLEFLDTVTKALNLMPFYAVNLEVLGKTISSLEKHGFTFPLTLKLVNTKGYQEKCPKGWEIFLKSLQNAKEEYQKRNLQFDSEIQDGQ